MNIDLQPYLENELVKLKPLKEEDFDPLFVVANDPLVWEQHQNFNRYEREIFEKFFSDALESKGALLIIDKIENQVIGSSRFNKIPTSDRGIEIGWSFLSRSYWGGQFNQSVKTLMINYLFNYISYVVFYIDKKNIRSQKAIEKMGAEKLVNPKFKDLIKHNNSDLTYCIDKASWNTRNP